ncbi:CBS domain-containing protein [Candidatus Nitronereus thalassa]|uniref:CBS domain-containing protein n=1 Tax=Candidatus Nitronereus thalassa TaxID=3020898 RepID=A0ABU3K735_9BACT|nr:CBS domain-containing protein [Candidatus Nitronereus thalassa]MDT7042254.1 CBS domain-containing protein [Candidatus Nitronereus thalassa]
MSGSNIRETKFGKMTVGQLMETNVQSANKDSKAEMLANYMMEGYGSVPIIDGSEKLVGIVSEFDLLKALRKGSKLSEVLASDVMTPNPISAFQGMDVPAVIDILQNNHLIRVPVVDGSGKLIGIIARRDVLRGYLQSGS